MKRHRFHPATLAKIILIAASRRAFDRETMRLRGSIDSKPVAAGSAPV
jgi:hypothetical protein